MEQEFEDAFDPTRRAHLQWLKNFVNTGRGKFLKHNPFGIEVCSNDYGKGVDIFVRLSRKLVNNIVYSKFGNVFSYEFSYPMDGEYQKCRLLKNISGYSKGTYFEYALVDQRTISFYNSDDDEDPVFTIDRV